MKKLSSNSLQTGSTGLLETKSLVQETSAAGETSTM